MNNTFELVSRVGVDLLGLCNFLDKILDNDAIVDTNITRLVKE